MVDRSNPNFLRNKYYFVDSSPNGASSCTKLMVRSKSSQTFEDVANAIEQYDCGYFNILEYVSKKHLNRELCERAVSINGLNLNYVPKRYLDFEMMELAFTDKYKNAPWHFIKNMVLSKESVIKIVSNDFCFLKLLPLEHQSYDVYKAAVENDFIGLALDFVNFKVLTESESLDICKTAVGNNGVAIKYVPTKFIDDDLVQLAVENSINLKEAFNLNSERSGNIKTNHLPSTYSFQFPIELIPKQYVSKDLVLLSIKTEPSSISVLGDYVDKDLCFDLLRTNATLIKYIPDQLVDMEMVGLVIGENPILFKDLPKKFKTNKVFNLLNAEQQAMLINCMPKEIPSKWSSSKKLIDTPDESQTYRKSEAEQPTDLVKVSDSYDIVRSSEFDNVHTFGYISDLHLEYQLKLFDKDPITCNKLIKKFTKSIVKQVPTKLDALFILGDVSSSIQLTNMFYRHLKENYGSLVISIMGNHELWRTDLEADISVDDIVKDYRDNIGGYTQILENELLVRSDSNRLKVINEDQILEYSDDELRKILLDSKYVVLGGIGFAGCNSKYNADYGLYCNRVNREEELELTQRFNCVYEKVLRCASDIGVIVATHMNHADWMTDECNENWVYLNGHTHQNHCEFSNGKPLVLADNQFGYKPKEVKIKSFTIGSNIFELLESYEDGIHEISPTSYLSFNKRRSIYIDGVYEGDILMVKREGLYMFFLRGDDKIYLLKGGIRRSIKNQDLSYYYDNMLSFEKKVNEFFVPYKQVLQEISNEIKGIGGDGEIHGAIVDIDFYNHVFINPIDGTVGYYFAESIVDKIFYKNLYTLLDESPRCKKRKLLKSNYQKLINGDKLDLINQKFSALGIVDKQSIKYTATDMYSVSRIILDYQYIFDSRVIRVWNDNLLNYEQGDDSNILALSE